MTELMCTINSVNELSTAQSDITSLQESVNNNTTNITTLQSYTVSSDTNFGVGPDVFDNLTTRTQNTDAIGAASGICPLDSATQVLLTYLPPATPTTIGALYGTPPVLTSIASSLSLGANAIAAGTWSIAIGNNVLTSANSSSLCNVAIGSLNLQNLTSGQHNTAIGQGLMVNLV